MQFGRDTCRVMSQPKERYHEITKQIASAYPIIHERVVGLYLAFLEHKCKYGGLVQYNVEDFIIYIYMNNIKSKICILCFYSYTI